VFLLIRMETKKEKDGYEKELIKSIVEEAIQKIKMQIIINNYGLPSSINKIKTD